MDGSIVYTTPSSKSTVTIKDCRCKTDKDIGGRMNRDWICPRDGLYYCPSCDEIMCSICISAPANEIINATAEETRWRCTECNVYVFEMNPIVSTALEMGLPMRIEEEEDEYKYSTRQNRPGAIQDSNK